MVSCVGGCFVAFPELTCCRSAGPGKILQTVNPERTKKYEVGKANAFQIFLNHKSSRNNTTIRLPSSLHSESASSSATS